VKHLESYHHRSRPDIYSIRSLNRLEAEIPIDTRDEETDMRNLPAHLVVLESILGKDTVNEALATGDPITIRVDWSR